MVDELKAEVSGPVDKFRLVYIIFYWLGIGTLLPWNMFITVGREDRRIPDSSSVNSPSWLGMEWLLRE